VNIFYIDHDPVQAAQWMVDKHVVKMILESAQLLSTAHRVLDGMESIGTSPSGRSKRYGSYLMLVNQLFIKLRILIIHLLYGAAVASRIMIGW
jgi:hypothetical protein